MPKTVLEAMKQGGRPYTRELTKAEAERLTKANEEYERALKALERAQRRWARAAKAVPLSSAARHLGVSTSLTLYRIQNWDR